MRPRRVRPIGGAIVKSCCCCETVSEIMGDSDMGGCDLREIDRTIVPWNGKLAVTSGDQCMSNGEALIMSPIADRKHRAAHHPAD